MSWFVLSVVCLATGVSSRLTDRRYRGAGARPPAQSYVLHRWVFLQYVSLPLAGIFFVVGIVSVSS